MPDRRRLIATFALATAVPLGARAWIGHRTDALADRLGERGRIPVSITRVEAELTGAVVLSGIDVPGLLTIGELEVGIGWDTLLGGRLEADEVRLRDPVLSLEVARDGSSNLSRAALRAANGRSEGPTAKSTRRDWPNIVVSGGRVRARLGDGLAELAAEGLRVRSTSAGLRLTTGPVTVTSRAPLAASIHFERAGADFDVDSGRILRLLAPEGRGLLGGHALENVLMSARSPDHLELAGAAGRGRIRVEYDAGAWRAEADELELGPLSSALPSFLHLSGARVSAVAELPKGGPLRVDVEVEDLGVNHPILASEAVPWTGHAALVLSGPDPWELRQLELRSGAVVVRASGRLDEQGGFSVRAELPRVSCQAVLDATPEPLGRTLVGMRLAGDIAFRAELRHDDGDTALDEAIEHDCRVVSEGPLADPDTLVRAFELTRGRRRLRRGPGTDDVPLAALPAYVPAAFVAAEDARFWQHDGFDDTQIARSLAANLDAGKVVRGGSTISQQLVKNAFLGPERSIARKLQEAVITWRVEARLSKKQILERYLNLIELGPDVYGIDEAARYWFSRSATELEPRQVAFLAALTRAPSTESRRITEQGRVPAALLTRVDSILGAMRRAGALTSRQAENARHAALVLRRGSLAQLGGSH